MLTSNAALVITHLAATACTWRIWPPQLPMPAARAAPGSPLAQRICSAQHTLLARRTGSRPWWQTRAPPTGNPPAPNKFTHSPTGAGENSVASGNFPTYAGAAVLHGGMASTLLVRAQW